MINNQKEIFSKRWQSIETKLASLYLKFFFQETKYQKESVETFSFSLNSRRPHFKRRAKDKGIQLSAVIKMV